MAWGEEQIAQARTLIGDPSVSEDRKAKLRARLESEMATQKSHALKDPPGRAAYLAEIGRETAPDPDLDGELPSLSKRKSLFRPPTFHGPDFEIMPTYWYEPKKRPDEDEEAYQRRADAAYANAHDRAKAAGKSIVRVKFSDGADRFGGEVLAPVAALAQGLNNASLGVPGYIASSVVGADNMRNFEDVADLNPELATAATIAGAVSGGSLLGQMGRATVPYVAAGKTAGSRLARAAGAGAAVGAGEGAVSTASEAAIQDQAGEQLMTPVDATERILMSTVFGAGGGLAGQAVGEGAERAVRSFRQSPGRGHQVKTFEDAGGEVGLMSLKPTAQMSEALEQSSHPGAMTPEDILYTAATDEAVPPLQSMQGAQRAAVDEAGGRAAGAGFEAPMQAASAEDALFERVAGRLDDWRTGRKQAAEAERGDFFAASEARGERVSSRPLYDKLKQIHQRFQVEGQEMPFAESPFGEAADRLVKVEMHLPNTLGQVPDALEVFPLEEAMRRGFRVDSAQLEQMAAAGLDPSQIMVSLRPVQMTARELEQQIAVIDQVAKQWAKASGKHVGQYREAAGGARDMMGPENVDLEDAVMLRENFPGLRDLNERQATAIAEEENLLKALGLEGIPGRIDPKDVAHGERGRAGLRKLVDERLDPNADPVSSRRSDVGKKWLTEQGFGEDLDALQTARTRALDVQAEGAAGATPGQVDRKARKAIEDAFRQDDWKRIETLAGPEQAAQLKQLAEDSDDLFSVLGIKRAGNVKKANEEYRALKAALERLREPGSGVEDQVVAEQLFAQAPELASKLKQAAGLRAYQRLRSGFKPHVMAGGGGVKGYVAGAGDWLRYRMDPIFKGLSKTRSAQPGASAGATADDIAALFDLIDAAAARGETQE